MCWQALRCWHGFIPTVLAENRVLENRSRFTFAMRLSYRNQGVCFLDISISDSSRLAQDAIKRASKNPTLRVHRAVYRRIFTQTKCRSNAWILLCEFYCNQHIPCRASSIILGIPQRHAFLNCKHNCLKQLHRCLAHRRGWLLFYFNRTGTDHLKEWVCQNTVGGTLGHVKAMEIWIARGGPIAMALVVFLLQNRVFVPAAQKSTFTPG